MVGCPPNKLDTHLVVELERRDVSMSKQSVKRWSANRKQEVVLRLLRGESLDYRILAQGSLRPPRR